MELKNIQNANSVTSQNDVANTTRTSNSNVKDSVKHNLNANTTVESGDEQRGEYISNNTLSVDNDDTKLRELNKRKLTNKTIDPNDKIDTKLQEVKTKLLCNETSVPVGEDTKK